MAETFSFRLAERLRKALSKHRVKYLFLGKSGAVILGYPDTTQDADIFLQKNQRNAIAVVKALKSLGFKLSQTLEREILRGKDFIQLRSGPFDLDLVFAPDGIESFEDAWRRRIVKQGYPVCHLDDIVRSKEAANRIKDRETLPRLRAFRDYWKKNQGS